MSYTYGYPRPMVTVDIVCVNDGKILLIKRGNDPFKNYWALPGGFVDEHEDLECAARRELLEETSLEALSLRQIKTYGTPNRDPRGHTISIAFYAECSNVLKAKAGDDAKELGWFDINNLPKLAFDHKRILEDSLQR